MGALVFENLKVADIHGYEHNAKTHPESQVQQIISSITKFGFNNPILIDENNEFIKSPKEYIIGSLEEEKAYIRGSFLL